MDTIKILYVNNCKSFQNHIAYFTTVYLPAQAKQLNLITIILYWFKYTFNTAEYYVFCYSILEMKVQFILGPQTEGGRLSYQQISSSLYVSVSRGPTREY
jgi:hypothetical protein